MYKSIYSDEYSKFLELFKTTRIKSGITQEQLAELVNETQSFISKCERGERRIDIIELIQLLKAMEVSPTSYFKKLTF